MGRPRRAGRRRSAPPARLPRRDRTNASVCTSSATRSASRSAVSDEAARRVGAPFSPVYAVSGGSHSATDTWPRGEVSPVTGSTSSPVSRAAASSGLGHGGRGQDEGGRGAVAGAEPAQPAYDVGDVGPEDAAVVVALVDHDVLQRAQEPRPPLVARQQRAVEHVGVGQDVLGVVAGPVALLAAAVAVVGGDPDVEPERSDRGHLVVGQRLGGREVEDGGPATVVQVALLADRGERRAAGRPATCPRRCRWPARRAGPRVPPRPPRPGAATVGRSRPGRGPRRRRVRPSVGQSACTAARGGSTSRWVSRSSRPGTADSRSMTGPSPEGRSRTIDVTRRV